MKNKNINWKAVIVVILSLGVVFAGGVYAMVQNNEINQQKSDGTIDRVAKQVDALYYDNGKIFLKKDIKADEVEAAQKAVEEINEYADEREKLDNEMKDVTRRFNIQDKVNNFFDDKAADNKEALNGVTIQEFVLIRDGLKKEDLDNFRKENKEALQTKDGFYKAINDLVKEAERQVKVFDDFDQQIENLSKDESLDYSGLEAKIADMKKEIEKEKNPLVKAKLLKDLGKADEDLVKSITDRRMQGADTAEEKANIRSEGQNAAQQAQQARSQLNQEGRTTQGTAGQNRGQRSNRSGAQSAPAGSSSQSSKAQSSESSAGRSEKASDRGSDKGSDKGSVLIMPPKQKSQPAPESGTGPASEPSGSGTGGG